MQNLISEQQNTEQPSTEQRNTEHANDPELKCIMVSLNTLTIALPIDRVEKIIKQTSVFGSGLTHLGLTHYEGSPITVIDLHYQLFQTRQIESSDNGYLIIAQTITQNRLALPIKEPPNLIEFPISRQRVIPQSYRGADTLWMATHVVRIAQPAGELLTVFMIDIDYLAERCIAQS
ncbi:MAG: chemotaxis protein CheW [Leptolyngbyaceae bacterium]|nr:chemotaxis protein CheW [Leptolyngbyaceae bacterium]